MLSVFVAQLLFVTLSNHVTSLTYTSDNIDLNPISYYYNQSINIEADPSIVYTEYGYIQGLLTSTARVFRKIPYARPPVNVTGRWKSPIEPESWGPNSILQALGDPPACPQPKCNDWFACGKRKISVYSEDCLYLNIYTPINDTITNITNNTNTTNFELLPVMFFLHGGQFENGYGGSYLYNQTDITNLTNVITVSINYRLGVLGYYWNYGRGFEGNYGIEDQIMALKWVRRNIKYFGGDENRVTVYGQSSGAMSIALLMMVEDIHEEFRSTILESPPFGIPLHNNQTWNEIPELFIKYSNCSNNLTNSTNNIIIDCLYNLTETQIINAQTQVDSSILNSQSETFLNVLIPWTPTIGSSWFTSQPLFAFQNGHDISNNKPLIIGNVANDSNFYIYNTLLNSINYNSLTSLMLIIFRTQENVKKIELQYPIPINISDYRTYLSILLTDGMFHCPNRNITQIYSERPENKDNVYFYHFNHLPSFSEKIWSITNDTECYQNVCDGDELAFVCKPNIGPVNISLTNEEEDLSNAMQFYWSQFCRLDDPGTGRTNLYNNGSVIEWVKFDSINQSTIIFEAENIHIIQNYDKQKCQLWDQIGYPWMS